jgi:hypothetical protein
MSYPPDQKLTTQFVSFSLCPYYIHGDSGVWYLVMYGGAYGLYFDTDKGKKRKYSGKEFFLFLYVSGAACVVRA